MSQDDQKDDKPAFSIPDPEQLQRSTRSSESSTFRSAPMIDPIFPSTASFASLSTRESPLPTAASPRPVATAFSGKLKPVATSALAPPQVSIFSSLDTPPASIQPTVLLPLFRKDVKSTLASAAVEWARQTPPQLPRYYSGSLFSSVIDILSSLQVLSNLVEAFRRMSIHVKYLPPSKSSCAAALSTYDDVEFFLSVWMTRTNGHVPKVYVELQPRRNDADDAMQAQVARDILLAARGDLSSVSRGDEEQSEWYYRGILEAESLLETERTRRGTSVSATAWSESYQPVAFAHSLMTSSSASMGSGPLDSLRAMSACRVGLESLAVLVDPSKVGTVRSVQASRIVLLGTDRPSSSFLDEDTRRMYQDIHEIVVYVVQKRCLPPSFQSGDETVDAMEWHVRGDDVDYFIGNTDGQSPEHKRAMTRLFHIALSILASALRVATQVSPELGDTEQSVLLSPTLVVEQFLAKAFNMTQTDMLFTLLHQLQQAESSPHTACLAATCLRYIGAPSRDALSRMSKLGGGSSCAHRALAIGSVSHVKLEWQCRQLVSLLEH